MASSGAAASSSSAAGPGAAASAADSRSVVAELLDALRADVRTKLLDLLDDCPGKKALVLDDTISGPLDSVVSSSDLRDHGITSFYKLSEQTLNLQDCPQVIFLVRCARPELVDWIAAQVLADEAAGQERHYVVVLVPRKTEQCLQRLTRSNVRANVRVVQCAMHFFPFDDDVCSMEMPDVFSDFHVANSPTGPYYVAKALMYLQAKVGTIPTVRGVGNAAKVVMQVMSRLRQEELHTKAAKDFKPSRSNLQPGVPPVAPVRPRRAEAGHAAGGASAAGQGAADPTPSIDEVIILDRRVDPFSVLLMQFTYLAQIDMVYGINSQVLSLSGMDWAKERKQQEKILRASKDEVYREIRDLRINDMGRVLHEIAQAVQKTYAEKDNLTNAAQISEFVSKFKSKNCEHSLVEEHANIAHSVKAAVETDYYGQQLRLEDDITAQASAGSLLESLEDWMDDGKPFHEVMRLLCLYSLVSNGIRKKDLDATKKVILQAYGYEHMLTVANLERVGLLRYQQGKSVWPSIKHKFQLFPDEADAANDSRNSVSYPYNGYVPLSVRLVQMTRDARGGWKGNKDALNLLYGSAEELRQSDDADVARPSQDVSTSARPSVTLVVFVGGVTYGELAALRRLSELEGGGRQFVVLTTELLSTKKLFKSLRYKEVFNQEPVVAAKAKPAAAPARGGFGFWPGGR